MERLGTERKEMERLGTERKGMERLGTLLDDQGTRIDEVAFQSTSVELRQVFRYLQFCGVNARFLIIIVLYTWNGISFMVKERIHTRSI